MDPKTKRIKEKLQAALAKIESEENVRFQFDSINDALPGNITFNCKVVDKVKESSMMKQLSKRYGFTQNIHMMEFDSGNATMRVLTFKTRNRKYPVICENVQTGQLFKYSAESVKRLLGGDAMINRKKNLEFLLNQTNEQ